MSERAPKAVLEASREVRPLRLALVLPRFGDDLVGGAELHGRWLAERLRACGHSMHVLTTCARDHRTWRNELPAGPSDVDGLRVMRFPVDRRNTRKHVDYERDIHQGRVLDVDEEVDWLRNGVSSLAMEEFLEREADQFDLVLGMPYLYGITYFAYAKVPDRFVLVPCLHDEPYARLQFVGEMLGKSRGLLFNTAPEVELARSLAPSLTDWAVVGVGFDPPHSLDVQGVRRRYGLKHPYLVYVGRREPGKNTHLLTDYFLRYKTRRENDLQLVLVGSGDEPPESPDVLTRTIDWADRDALCRGGLAFCQPSVNESLSIVLLQAWLAGSPALVHGNGSVTRYHCERSNGGLWFNNYAQFEAVVDTLSSSSELCGVLGANGRAYVEREFTWPVVLGRFHDAVERWVEAE
jgi:glycosyltransferase involved in cell wall biosynthesis